jgi:LPXTG-site transpeptidase (sortase) family protein
MFGFGYKSKKVSAVVSALALAAGMLAIQAVPASAVASTQNEWHTLQGNNWKTTICHRTHAVTNPYRKITVSDASVYGTSGHSNPNHDRDYTVGGVTYHVFTSTITYPSNSKFWGDIIPPQNPARYSTNNNTPSNELNGVNWITEGIAIYDGAVAGCRTMTDREFIAAEVEGGATSQEIAQDLNDQDPDGPRWTQNSVNTEIASIQTATATLSLVNDVNSTAVNTQVSGSAATNDTKPAGATFAKQSDPSHGTVTMDAAGNYAYTPSNNYSGSDSFTYKVCLPSPNTTVCKIATVTISIATAGQPVAGDDNEVTSYLTAITASTDTNDVVPANSTFELDLSDSIDANEGTLSFNPANGRYTYTPANNFSGNATFKYKVCLPSPSTTCSASAIVTIEVIRSRDDSNTTAQDTSVSGSMIANDTAGLVYNSSTVVAPAHGSVTITSNGSYTYTPSNGYYGTDQFTYRACHLSASTVCTESVVTITITQAVVTPPSNNSPAPAPAPAPTINVNNDKGKTKANKPLQSTVTGNDNPGLGNKKVSDTKNGTVELSTNGTYTYVPAPDFVGKDSYTYNACDANGLCAVATVEILVTPDASDDASKTKRNVPVTASAAKNDTKALVYNKTSEPANGTVTLQKDGSYKYVPKSGFTGKDKFSYVACDPQDETNCADAIVEIEIAELEVVAPKAEVVAKPNVPVEGKLPDSEGSGLTYSLEAAPKFGKATVKTDGSYVYTPTPGFTGVDSFTYRAADPENVTMFRTARVSLQVAYVTTVKSTLVLKPRMGVARFGGAARTELAYTGLVAKMTNAIRQSIAAAAVRPKSAIPEGKLIAKIRVPRFGVNYVRNVYEGTSVNNVLNKLGIGHYEETEMPGEAGNFAIAGHRTGNGGPFRNIDKFRAGDIITVETSKGSFSYKYLATKVVKPSAVGVIAQKPVGLVDPENNGHYLTLTSCTPIGVNTDRIVAWFSLVTTK